MDKMFYHKNWIIGLIILSSKIMVIELGQEISLNIGSQHDSQNMLSKDSAAIISYNYSDGMMAMK